MKTLTFTMAAWTLSAAVCFSQDNDVVLLGVGKTVSMFNLDAKVMQVIDSSKMLVGLEDRRRGGNLWSTWIMLKTPTTGMVDGKIWYSDQWRQVTGAGSIIITGTTTYTTVLGATKTVYVAEPDLIGEKRQREAQFHADQERRKREAEALAIKQRAIEEARIEAEKAAAAKRLRDEEEARLKPGKDSARKLVLAKDQMAQARREIADGNVDTGNRLMEFAIRRLREIVANYPDTPAAAEAKQLLQQK